MAHIVTIDAGSTKFAVSGREKKVYYQTCRTGNGLPPASFVDSVQFEEVMGELAELIPSWGILGITGLKHSLVPYYVNGRVQAGLIADDPSLSPQNGLPPELLSVFPEERTAAHSAVRKLFGFKNHPDLWPVVLKKDDLAENQICYTGFLSYLARYLSREPLGIFPDEARDYKPETPGIHKILGVREDQLPFEPNQQVELPQGKKIRVKIDFNVEAEVVKKLLGLHLIPPGAHIFATDGVLKRLREAPEDGLSTIEDLFYDTMRRMGNTGTKQVLPLMQQRGVVETGKNGANHMFTLFELWLRDSNLPRNWLYDPRAKNQYGTMWRKQGMSWHEVTDEEMVALTADEFKTVVQAYGWGMGCAMYEGLPEIDDAVIYGGLMGLFGTIQEGWGHVFLQATPARTRVHWLNLPDAGVAMALRLREDEGEVVDWQKEAPIQALSCGGDKVREWVDLKAEIKAQGVYC